MSRSRRIVALLVVAALLFTTTAYFSHTHSTDAKFGDTAHCDLCLQFHGSAGPPVLPLLDARLERVVVLLRLDRGQGDLISRDQPRSHRSRAPPSIA